MKPLVLVTAPVGTRSGYGAHSRDICRSLINMDRFDIKIFPVRWGSTPQNALSEQNPEDIPIIQRLLNQPNMERQPDIHIHIVVPNEFSPIGKFNIGITAGIETTLCPPEWIEGLNRMNMNIVPANFVKETIERSVFDKKDEKTNKLIEKVQITKPLEVLFEGADLNVYKKTNEFSKDLVTQMEGIEEDFCFLFVGHWLQGGMGNDRKDVGHMVKTFLESFRDTKDKPALVMKTSGATPCVIDREDMLKQIRDIKGSIKGDLPNVYLLHGDFRDDEINGLYNHPKIKAHLSFTHGEGFGRPLLEASLSEKPVIAPNWGGQIDFLSAENSITLPTSLVEVPGGSVPKGMLVQGAQWSQVNYQYASNVLKEVYKNYSKYTLKGKKQAIVNRTKFSLDAMTVKFEEILDKHLPKFEEQPQQVNLKLPKLKKVGETKEPPKLKLPKLKKVSV